MWRMDSKQEDNDLWRAHPREATPPNTAHARGMEETAKAQEGGGREKGQRTIAENLKHGKEAQTDRKGTRIITTGKTENKKDRKDEATKKTRLAKMQRAQKREKRKTRSNRK